MTASLLRTAKIFLIGLALVIAGISDGLAGEKPAPLTVREIPQEDRPVITVTRQVEAKMKLNPLSAVLSVGGLGAGVYVLKPRIYRPRLTLSDGTHEWLLVEYEIIDVLDGSPLYRSAAPQIISTCTDRFEYFFAIDENSGEVAGSDVRIQTSECVGRPRKTKISWNWKLNFRQAGSLSIQPAVEARRQEEIAHRQEEIAHREKEIAHRSRQPQVKQIGARICRYTGSARLVGYTEARSPDNDRIQIRVSEAHQFGDPNLSPAGFREHVIWDDPIRWDICE